MTTTTDTPEKLRGDVCPSWCSGEHFVDRGSDEHPLHPVDRGVLHHSARFDAFGAVETPAKRLDLPVARPLAHVEMKLWDHPEPGDVQEGPFVYAGTSTSRARRAIWSSSTCRRRSCSPRRCCALCGLRAAEPARDAAIPRAR